MSVTLSVDGIRVSVPEGTKVIDAARAAGINVPSLCHLEGHPPRVSCGLCVMEDARDGTLFPSCARVVTEGLAALSGSQGASAARKAAVEILLSEHTGDCTAPCSRACPAGLEVMRAVKLWEAGDLRAAMEAALETLPFPGLMASSCAGYCERACRHRLLEGGAAAPIGIREMHAELARAFSVEERAAMIRPAGTQAGGAETVSIMGAGLAALSAAFFTLRSGRGVIVVGDPMAAAPAEAKAALEQELAVLRAAGCAFTLAPAGGAVMRLEGGAEEWRMPARAIAAGRNAAGAAPEGRARAFQSVVDHVTQEELPAAPRCLSCGCGKASACRLRQIAEAEGADRRRFSGRRIPMARQRIAFPGGTLLVEPGKCVKCGICVRLSAHTPFPLTFMGRGFDLHVGGFEAGVSEPALRLYAEQCPTGALVWEDADA